MKICFVGWGDHVHLERWAGYFADQGNEVAVISFSGRGDYPQRVVQYTMGLGHRGQRWKVFKLRYLLWKIKPDLVHVHWAHFADLVAKVWAGPLIVTVWGSDILQLNTDAHGLKEGLVRGLQAAHAVTCDSEQLSAHIKKLRKDSHHNVHVIQWGVDVKRFCLGAPDFKLVSELGVSGHPVVFSPRSFRPIYNLENIVSAFALVLRVVPNAVLLMKNYNGSADYMHAMRKHIDELGLGESVRIVSDLPYERMRELYRMSTVTVSIPFSDSTPMSVLEAMACGSVPIVSDLPSLREWIQDGWNGYVVPPNDPHHLAERIVHVIEHPEIAAECVRRNLKIVEDRAKQVTHMARMADVYHEVLNSIAGKNSKGAICRFIMLLVSLFFDTHVEGPGLEMLLRFLCPTSDSSSV